MMLSVDTCVTAVQLSGQISSRQVPAIQISHSLTGLVNRPFWYSLDWTGTSLKWRPLRENIIKNNFMTFAFEKIPLQSENMKLVYCIVRVFNRLEIMQFCVCLVSYAMQPLCHYLCRHVTLRLSTSICQVLYFF